MGIARLHFITQDNIEGFSHAQLAEQACMGGAEWIQLRVKNKSEEEWHKIALEVKDVCHQYKAKLIINDHVPLCKKINAEGVHLGKQDMSPSEARNLLGDDYIIGGTANTFSDVECLAKSNVDYIGLGPFRFTTTKENLSPILGLEGYLKIIQNCKEAGISIPIIGIGGITPNDIKDLLTAGLFGIAVSSIINKSEDKGGSTKQIIGLIEKHLYHLN